MSDSLQICIDKVLPDELQAEAQRRAIEENPANLPGPPAPGEPTPPPSIALLKGKLWAPGRTLRVRFMGGDPVLQRKVQDAAEIWMSFANINFVFGDFAEAEIRVAFVPDGSWSYLGTDALTIDQFSPTMNFGWLTPYSSNQEISRVVLHEFGHALGCIHEHQHPGILFEWDEAAVMAYYTSPPNNWPPAQVKSNVLNRYSATLTNFSAFDSRSIMLYPIPEEHTKGTFSVPWRNSVLSDTDKAFIKTQYPS